MNPLSQALVDFHSGNQNATFTISRDDGYFSSVPVAPFFDAEQFPDLEQKALEQCRGHVLDIGAAAGRHSLQLIQSGFEVTSLDILPEMEAILRDRGIAHVVVSDIFKFTGGRFDTLLMLMNGIGMVGTLDGLDRFLEHAHKITSQSGQIICDSIDVSVTSDPVHSDYRQRSIALGQQPGQQTFTITYNDITGESFDWLHVDFVTLSTHASLAGWNAEIIQPETDGHYLCRLIKNSL